MIVNMAGRVAGQITPQLRMLRDLHSQYQAAIVDALSVSDAAIAFTSASPKILSTLNTVLNDGLRIATGAFKSSPIDSLLCESGKLPLQHRQKLHIISFYVKIAHNPDHILHQQISCNSHTSSKSVINRSK